MKRILSLALVVLAVGGCASSFEQRWKSEVVPGKPNTLAGKWTGGWVSFTGQRGQLRAIIVEDAAASAAATQPGTRIYRGTFESIVGLLKAAEYQVDFVAKSTSDGETFTATSNLTGGYTYEVSCGRMMCSRSTPRRWTTGPSSCTG